MKKISSASTKFFKTGFPIIWFGSLALAVISSISAGAVHDRQWMFLAVPCFMAVLGFVLMKKLLWDLADEVFDCGDALLIRNKGDEERVPLSNVMNVNASTNTNPPRITLRLVKAGRFGAEISFSPVKQFSFNPFARNAIADDLIVRVDRARRQRPL